MHKIKLRNSPPKLAYSYYPSSTQVLVETETYVERLIFYKQDYRNWEISALENLESVLKCGDFDRPTLLRFLYGNGWDIMKTWKSIQRHKSWKSEWPEYMSVYPSVQNILISGGVYIHGHDNYFRPIVILRLEKLAQLAYNLHVACAYFLLEFIIDCLLIPGQVENWVVLIDFEDFKETNQSKAKKLVIELYTHYQCRLGKAYIINQTRLWKQLYQILPRITSKKFVLVDKNHENLYDEINRNQLELKYGGSLPNLKRYWPPRKIKWDTNDDFLSSYSNYAQYFPDKGSYLSDIYKKDCAQSPDYSFVRDVDIDLEHHDIANFEKFTQRLEKSQEMTLASLKGPIRTISIENYEIEPNWLCNACIRDKSIGCLVM